MEKLKGARKLVAGLGALVFLALGYAASLAFRQGPVVFPPYATAVVGVLTAVVGGNVGEHFASKAARAPSLKDVLP